MKNHTPRNPGELRRLAEERLREKQSGQPASPRGFAAPAKSEVGGQQSTEEAAQMLHELQVHQIELEMRNEELRRAQAEIEAGRARYFDLYDLAPVGYCTLSEKGLILEANLTAANLLGTARGALVKQPISHFIAKEDQDVYYLHRKQLFETGEPQKCELRLVKADGANFWAHLTATAAQADDGAPVCRMTFSDISERKRAEECLRESEERFRAANDASLDALLLLRSERNEAGEVSDFVFLDLNRRTEEMLRMSREQLLGRRLCEVLPINREAGFFEKYKRVMDTGIPLEEEFFLPETHVPAAWYYHQVVKVGDGIFICHHDIGERKRAEEEQKRLQAQFLQAQKMESVGRLAGGVAHDFNNMIMGIMGYAGLCQDAIGAEHPACEWLDEILREAQRSANLTRQLLAFARKQTISPKVLDLNDAVAGMLKLLRRLIGEDIKLAWRPGVDLRPVRIDPSQIDQILANLCVNARDAIAGVGEVTLETGSIAIDAEYCAKHPEAIPGAYVFLDVTDNGCGMDSATLAQVFEPFFTTKGLGKGTGLGLATVYGIVKQNNGFIYAYSEPGKGTTFKIYLPEIAAETVAATVTRKAEAPRGRGETILLVEDEKSLRVTCGAFLDPLGYNVMVAETPGEALKMVAGHPGDIHVLLTDVVMPGMDGRQLAKRISAVKPGVKVLFMSGYTSDVIAQRGVLDEGVQFLSKPFTRDDLARKLREILEGPRPG